MSLSNSAALCRLRPKPVFPRTTGPGQAAQSDGAGASLPRRPHGIQTWGQRRVWEPSGEGQCCPARWSLCLRPPHPPTLWLSQLTRRRQEASMWPHGLSHPRPWPAQHPLSGQESAGLSVRGEGTQEAEDGTPGGPEREDEPSPFLDVEMWEVSTKLSPPDSPRVEPAWRGCSCVGAARPSGHGNGPSPVPGPSHGAQLFPRASGTCLTPMSDTHGLLWPVSWAQDPGILCPSGRVTFFLAGPLLSGQAAGTKGWPRVALCRGAAGCGHWECGVQPGFTRPHMMRDQAGVGVLGRESFRPRCVRDSRTGI